MELQFHVGCICDGDPSVAAGPADAVSKNVIVDDDRFGADDSFANHPTWNDGPTIVDGDGDPSDDDAPVNDDPFGADDFLLTIRLGMMVVLPLLMEMVILPSTTRFLSPTKKMPSAMMIFSSEPPAILSTTIRTWNDGPAIINVDGDPSVDDNDAPVADRKNTIVDDVFIAADPADAVSEVGPAIVFDVAVNNVAPAIVDDDPVDDADPTDAASVIAVTTDNAEDAIDEENTFDDDDPADAVIEVDIAADHADANDVDDYFANDDTANAVINIE